MPTLVLFNSICLQHLVPEEHPEKPERLFSVMKAVENLQQKYPNSITVMQDFEMVPVTHLLIAHSAKYYETLQNSVPSTDEPQRMTQYSLQPDTGTQEDLDTFLSAHSLQAACYAAGSVCCALDQVNQKKIIFLKI